MTITMSPSRPCQADASLKIKQVSDAAPYGRKDIVDEILKIAILHAANSRMKFTHIKSKFE